MELEFFIKYWKGTLIFLVVSGTGYLAGVDFDGAASALIFLAGAILGTAFEVISRKVFDDVFKDS